jgi:hypothetical protein
VVTVPASDRLPNVSLWHVPPACASPVSSVDSAARLGLASGLDCVSSPCTATRCNYTVHLPTPGIRYAFSVRGSACTYVCQRPKQGCDVVWEKAQ